MSSSSARASAARSPPCGWPRKVIGVTVFESGRRFEDEEFARTSWDVRRYFWAPRLGCYGVQRIHKLPDVMLLAGAGVGGGSLNYANTLYVPPKAFFDDPQWQGITDWAAELAPHYDQAARMLGVVENPCEGPVEEIMRAVADDMGVGHTFRKTPVGVFFGRPDPATGAAAAGAGRSWSPTRSSAAPGRRAPAAPSAATAWSAAGSAPRTRWSRTTSPSPSGWGRGSSRCAPSSTSARSTPADPTAGFAVTHRADRRLAAPGPADGHGRPGRAGRRHLGHPEAAALAAGLGRRCPTCRRGWAS